MVKPKPTIYQQENCVKFLGSNITLLDVWLKRLISRLYSLHPGKQCIIGKVLKITLMLILIARKNQKLYLGLEKSCIAVYQRTNKRQIYKDKLNWGNLPSLTTKFMQMLVLESIGKEKVLTPFWKEPCKELYLK